MHFEFKERKRTHFQKVKSKDHFISLRKVFFFFFKDFGKKKLSKSVKSDFLNLVSPKKKKIYIFERILHALIASSTNYTLYFLEI